MLNDRLLKELREIFGPQNVLTDSVILKKKSLDLCPDNLTIKKGEYPTGAAVVVPSKNYDHQLQELVEFAHRHGLKILTLGGGSGVCKAFRTWGGEIVVDMTALDKIVLIKKLTATEDGLAMVEAGVFGDKLDEFLKQEGVTHGHYPASLAISTVGGWVSTKSNGILSLFFGNIENLVVAVEGVDGKGELVRLKGTDLKKVFRMEGTTMIVTQVWLKVFAIPTHDDFLSFQFNCIGDTVCFLKKMPSFREQLKQLGVRLYTVRAYDFIDYKFMSKPHKGDSHKPWWLKRASYFAEKQLCRASQTIGNLTGVLERQGGAPWTVIVYMSSDFPEVLSQAAEMLKDEARVHNGADLGPAIAHSWYSHRFKLGYDKVIERFNADISVDTFESTMDWEKVIDAYEEVRATIFKFGLVGAHIGIDLDRPYLYFIYGIAGKNKQKYERAREEILHTCIKIGIATTHHHGIGWKAGRNKVLAPYAYGPEWYYGVAVPAKQEMDPHNILNPHNFIK